MANRIATDAQLADLNARARKHGARVYEYEGAFGLRFIWISKDGGGSTGCGTLKSASEAVAKLERGAW